MRRVQLVAFLVLLSALPALAQSTGSLTQTVNKRGTIGVLTASPSSGLTTGTPVTFTYTLHTAGAPAPTSETVQFMDGASALGSPQTITSVAATNLLPYSQISTGNGWTTSGTTPTVTSGAANGPDGSTGSATQVAFPNTSSSGTSGVQFSVAGTSYASSSVTVSVWAQSTANTTLTLGLTDSPAVSASGSTTCAVTSVWQRCNFTLAFPSNAGSGFVAAFRSTNVGAQTINLWGSQVEQATAAGPYVSTIGSARPTGAQGGSVSFVYSTFTPATHTITVAYAGDTNFNASTSNTAVLAYTKGTAGLTLTASAASPSIYGTALTFTATFTGQSGLLPTGTVQLMDGATVLGSGTINGSGVATVALSGTSSLGGGSHSLTISYPGDSNFNSITSSVLPYVISKSSATTVSVTSSLNPSIYGDVVTISANVTSAAGAIPTGTVAITDNGVALGTVTLNGAGSATLAIPLFTAGAHPLVATYSGDANYQ